MTKEMFEWITKWQREVFTQATSLSAVNQLREEIEELAEQLHIGHEPSAKSEYADCFLLLFGSASLYGLSYEDICDAINEKMEINKNRKWGSVNKQGYVKHEDSPANINKVEEDACSVLFKHPAHDWCKGIPKEPAVNVEEEAEAKDWRQELFSYLNKEYGLILLQEEMFEIENIINPKKYPYTL